MKNILLIIVFSAVSIYINGQIDWIDLPDSIRLKPIEGSKYLYLTSDRIVYGSEIVFKKHHLTKQYSIEIDNVSYQHSDVKFVNTNNGFYANTSMIENQIGEPSFTRRVMDGKINLYEDTKEVFEELNNLLGPTLYSNQIYPNRNTLKKTYNYYNVGFNDIKKVNYANLSLDLSDNNKSITFLEKYKKSRNGQISLIVFGCATGLGAIYTLLNYENTSGVDNKIERRIIAYTGITAVSVALSFQAAKKKRQHLHSTIFIYNME